MPIENISRRTLLGSATAAVCLAALSKAGARPTEWKPRLGILGKYTEANVDFAIQEEFNNMILSAGAGVPGLDMTKITDEEIARSQESFVVERDARFGAAGEWESYRARSGAARRRKTATS